MIGRTTLNEQIVLLKQILGLIEVLFLGWISVPESQPNTIANYFQGDCSQTQRISTSRYPYLLLNYFVVKYVRVVLPRLHTGGGLLETSHDSWILASSASSIVKVSTIRSCTWIRFLPFLRIEFNATII